jgi:low affinity Fe/Cu permease
VEPTRSRSRFTRLAKTTAHATGKPMTFGLAVAIVLLWIVSGPLFGFSNTWQLFINTTTTIVTFLMVFLIQSTQNRDGKAVQVKLDELIRVSPGAHVALLDLEELEDDELERICVQYEQLAERARRALREGKPDTDAPRITPGKATRRAKK